MSAVYSENNRPFRGDSIYYPKYIQKGACEIKEI